MRRSATIEIGVVDANRGSSRQRCAWSLERRASVTRFVVICFGDPA